MSEGVKSDEGKAPARYMYLAPLEMFSDYYQFSGAGEILEEIIFQLTAGTDNNAAAQVELLIEIICNKQATVERISKAEVMKNVSYVSKLGAEKYGIYNYQKGMDWSRIVDALCRHMIHSFMGDDIDEESGKDHRYHVLANLFMLLYFIENEVGVNDLKEETKGE